MIPFIDSQDILFRLFYCGPNGNLNRQFTKACDRNNSSAGKSSMTPYVIDSVPLNHSAQQSHAQHFFPKGGAAKSGISLRVMDR